jgi:hypothetical protein
LINSFRTPEEKMLVATVFESSTELLHTSSRLETQQHGTKKEYVKPPKELLLEKNDEKTRHYSRPERDFLHQDQHSTQVREQR